MRELFLIIKVTVCVPVLDTTFSPLTVHIVLEIPVFRFNLLKYKTQKSIHILTFFTFPNA